MAYSLLVAVSTLLALPPLMPIDDLQRGQRGECLTVFEGYAIEPVPFVVKGVMENYLGPGRHLVLVRLEGNKAEFTGVVAGMSGSPCSVGGKLIGALSYAFATFAKEPIAGITPYDGMADVMRLPTEAIPWRTSPNASLNDKPLSFADTKTAKQAPLSTEGFVPIATPLALGGVPQSVLRHFDPWFRDEGFEPMAAGSSTKDKSKPAQEGLKPGSAVAAVLVRGDVNIAATGTVTSVEGNEVLAFGHPFVGAGAVSLPMAQAEILNTMASAMRSFKMSSTGPIIGELTQDRLTALGGILGPRPTMIPVTGTINTARGPASYQFEVARDVGLSPRFVAVALASALNGRVDVGERGMVRLEGRITGDNLPPITIRNVYAAERDGNLLTYAAVDMAQSFASLWDTPFGPPPNLALDVRAVFEPEPIIEAIEAMHLDSGAVRAGKSLDIAVRLRRKDGPIAVERFTINIPSSWANESIELIATDADGLSKLEQDVGGDVRPTELRHIAKWLASRPSQGSLYLVAIREGSGLRSGVDMMSMLPPSAIVTLSGDPGKQQRRRGFGWQEQHARQGMVVGRAQRTVRILAN